ncbi:MAG: hypothetical protein ACI9FJ_002478 [Alteromonadaceae bacterium]|jgi:hypothetical protein
MVENLFKNKSLEQRRKFVRAIVERLLIAYKLEKVKDLTEIFDCTYGAVKNWGSMGKIPQDPIFQCHFETGVSLDWLVHGGEPIVVFSKEKAEALKKHLANQLASSVRFQLIEQKCANGVDMLAEGLSGSLLEWMKVTVVEDLDMPVNDDKDDC